MFLLYISEKGLTSRKCLKFQHTNNKQILFLEWAEVLNRHFIKDRVSTNIQKLKPLWDIISYAPKGIKDWLYQMLVRM